MQYVHSRLHYLWYMYVHRKDVNTEWAVLINGDGIGETNVSYVY